MDETFGFCMKIIFFFEVKYKNNILYENNMVPRFQALLQLPHIILKTSGKRS